MSDQQGILAVGNYDSNTGYAWRLMETLWCQLSESMKPKGYKMHLCFATISIIPKCIEDAEFIVERLDFTKKDIKSLLSQIKYIKRNNIKVIYLTDFPTFALKYLLFRAFGVKKIIVHDHTPGFRVPSKGLKKLLKSTRSKIPCLNCDAAFAVSPYVYQRIKSVNCFPEEKIFCVTNGIEPSVDVCSRQENKIVKIVTVGRITYYKGIDFAIKVMAWLVYELGIKNFKYSIYGDGPNLKEFEQLARELNVSDYVFFEGASNEVDKKLLSADIAFHPSRGEAMCLAILEYMRASLPVVVSSNPSVNSALLMDEDAVIYEEESVKGAASALVKLISNSSLRIKMGVQAKRNMEEKYSKKEMLINFTDSIKLVFK